MTDTPSTATLTTWARKSVYWFGGLLFLAGFAMSAVALTKLMQMVGIPDEVAWTLFLALDAGAIVGVVMWVGGTGPVSDYGRSTARSLFLLSIVGNALERLLAFNIPAGQPTPTSVDVTLHHLVVLLKRLFQGDDPTATVALWFLLAMSIGIGIVFPTLAYRMGHAIILARQTSPAARRKAGRVTRLIADWFEARFDRGPAPAPAPAPAREEKKTPAKEVAAKPKEPAEATPAREEKRTPAKEVAAKPKEPAEATPAPVARLPYVHDPADHPIGSPEWEDRYNRLPGDTKSAKLEFWLRKEWEEGRRPVLAAADRVVAGNRLATTVKASLAERGIFPPGEGPDDVPERTKQLAAVS
jgi:Predicted membrane protein